MSASTHPRPEVPPLTSSALPARRVETLDHGMKATLVQAGVIPIAAIRIVLRVGSVDVPADRTWLDRLVHSFLREGTEERDAESFASALAALGGRLEVEGDEHMTSIGTEVPSEHAAGVIALLAELVQRPRFPEEAEERLIDDLQRTLDIAGSQPGWLAYAAFRESLYGDHPYGRVLPHEDALAQFSTAAARDFWARHAGPEGAHLMVAGLFDEAAVLDAARAGFHGWAPVPAAPPVPAPPAPTAVVRIVDRPGAEQSTLQIGVPIPAPGHPDYVPLEVLNSLLGGSFYSRITQNIREEKGYTYSPRSSISARPGDAYWVESADVTTNVTGASISEILKEIGRLRDEPPTAEELAGIVNYMSGAFVIRQATPGGILNHLEFLDLHGLDASYSATYVARVAEVTPAEIQRLAREYLRPEVMPIVVVGDRAAVEGEVGVFGPLG